MLINPLNAELNPICHLLALLGAHHILHVSRIRLTVNENIHKIDGIRGRNVVSSLELPTLPQHTSLQPRNSYKIEESRRETCHSATLPITNVTFGHPGLSALFLCNKLVSRFLSSKTWSWSLGYQRTTLVHIHMLHRHKHNKV